MGLETVNKGATHPGQSGAAAMLSMAIIAILFILVVSGLVIVQLSKATVNRQLVYHGQAINAANAGLVESLSWFRRQASQPVTAFAPQVDALIALELVADPVNHPLVKVIAAEEGVPVGRLDLEHAIANV